MPSVTRAEAVHVVSSGCVQQLVLPQSSWVSLVEATLQLSPQVSKGCLCSRSTFVRVGLHGFIPHDSNVLAWTLENHL